MIIAGCECGLCFVKQIDKIISIGLKEKNDFEKLDIFKRSLKYLSEIDFNITPPELARKVYNYLYNLTGNSDPFAQIKETTNKEALKIANEIFKDNEISLKDYVKYAIAGNIIDFGIGGMEFKYEEIKNIHFKIFHFHEFNNLLQNAKSLLYIPDNSGEIIFDKFLIKKIKELYPSLNITIAGRNNNIINDVTYNDLINLGFNEIVNVISTGYDGAGVPLGMVSNEFKEIFNNADIIISKGQGNFETIYGEKNLNIFFGLKIKCNHVAKITGLPINSNIFAYNKLL